MLSHEERSKIISLIRKEVVPALGCTEPVAVALATARSREALGEQPESIDVLVSANIFKNGMGVGIPGTGMAGLPIAAALGAVCGRSEDGLEVLQSVNPDHLETAKTMLQENRIRISVKPDTDPLYVESVVKKGPHTGRTVIVHRHTHIVRVEKDGNRIFQAEEPLWDQTGPRESVPDLSVAKVVAFAQTAPLEEIGFILKGAELNVAIADQGMTGDFGLGAGRTIRKNIERRLIADDLASCAMSLAAAASDARMDGSTLPVMSNSGSGNQGITTILPVVAVARKIGADEEKLIRALILSNLMAIYIKQFMDPLTALCGIVTAATGAACGICLLLGGTYTQICGTIQNMAAGITGMICDGAKQGCALKVSAGVSTAVYSALLAMEGRSAVHTDGIIDEDVDHTVRNIGRLANQGMVETDRYILDTLRSK